MSPLLHRQSIIVLVSFVMLLAGCEPIAEGNRAESTVVQTATAPRTVFPNTLVGTWQATNTRAEVQVWRFYADGTVEMHYLGEDPAQPIVTGSYNLEGTTLSLSLLHPKMKSATAYRTEVHIEGSEMTIMPHPSDDASFVVGVYRRIP